MDFLWSPWRYEYIASAGKLPSCVFCVGTDPGPDTDRLILFRGDHNFIIMNLFPYTSGHLMIAPYAHIARLSGTTSEQTFEMMELSKRSIRALDSIYHPEGYNLGMNLGQCAGAGVKDHLHLHIVPRWTGDTNFTTTVGETRVVPEDLRATYKKLKPFF